MELNVLSVIAQLMLTIQSAKAQNAIKVVFQETTLKLDASCGVFVTINPDYPGNILVGKRSALRLGEKNLKLKHEQMKILLLLCCSLKFNKKTHIEIKRKEKKKKIMKQNKVHSNW